MVTPDLYRNTTPSAGGPSSEEAWKRKRDVSKLLMSEYLEEKSSSSDWRKEEVVSKCMPTPQTRSVAAPTLLGAGLLVTGTLASAAGALAVGSLVAGAGVNLLSSVAYDLTKSEPESNEAKQEDRSSTSSKAVETIEALACGTVMALVALPIYGISKIVSEARKPESSEKVIVYAHNVFLNIHDPSLCVPSSPGISRLIDMEVPNIMRSLEDVKWHKIRNLESL